MISVDGAALIAQVYPVAILLIALELRGVQPLLATGWQGVVALGFFAVVAALTVIAGIESVRLCIFAVAQDRPLRGLEAGTVAVAGQLLLASASVLLLYLIAQRFGVWDRISEWSVRRTSEKNPERRLSDLEFIERFHRDVKAMTPEMRVDLEERIAAAKAVREAADTVPPIPPAPKK